MSWISIAFHAAFYNPIYNALVALVAVVPGGDVGIAVILLTLAIRLILLPLSLSAARTQRAMKALDPKLKALKEEHKGNKEKEAVATLALYREARVNPFASFFTVLIQLPVLLGLYWVFRYEPFSKIDVARLYFFTPVPHMVSLQFLGLVSVAGKSILLSVLAGASQYLQAHMMLSGTAKPVAGATGMQVDFQRVMGTQMKYVFPFIIAVICYSTSGAVGLYFITTNIAGALQEWHVRRKFAAETAHKTQQTVTS